MKLNNTAPLELRSYISTEHQRALNNLINDSKNKTIIHVPMHTAPMKILNQLNIEEIKHIIVPPVNIKLHENHRIDNTHINKRGFSYYIAYNNKPFPLAHVFNQSGSLCLGNIFVPSKISIHNPMQPLETLFTNNDRYIQHGNAKLTINQHQYDTISKLIKCKYDIDLISFRIQAGINLIYNDSIWLLSSYILDATKNKNEAFDFMDKIYNIIFSLQKG